MNRHLAHLLRRTARKLIAWSNRLDGPKVTFDPPSEDRYTYEMSRDGAVWETCDPPAGFPSIDEIKRAHEFRPL